MLLGRLVIILYDPWPESARLLDAIWQYGLLSRCMPIQYKNSQHSRGVLATFGAGEGLLPLRCREIVHCYGNRCCHSIPSFPEPQHSSYSSNTKICHPVYWLANLWSGRRGSNPRPLPWQGSVLPLNYSRIFSYILKVAGSKSNDAN
jgi:hypothetical protein